MADKVRIPQLTDQNLSTLITTRRRLNEKFKDQKDAIDYLTKAAVVLDSEEVDKDRLAEALSVLSDALKGKGLKTALAKLDTILLSQLSDDCTSKSNPYATIARTKFESYTVVDPELLIEHSMNTNDLDMFTKAVNKSWAIAYVDAHGKLPPGVDLYSEYRLSFTKKSKNLES